MSGRLNVLPLVWRISVMQGNWRKQQTGVKQRSNIYRIRRKVSIQSVHLRLPQGDRSPLTTVLATMLQNI